MSPPFPPQGRLAGVDFGTVRMGIAITDPQQKLASPYQTYTRGGPEADARYFRQLVQQERIAGFVVGLPVHASGQESAQSQEARRFGAWLAQTGGVPVCFVDERYTSVEAGRILGQAQLTGKRRKQRLDMLAAQILLSAYLENPSRAQQTPKPLED